MIEIVVLSTDELLKEELSSILPKGFKLSVSQPMGKNAIIFFDLDTMRPILIRELSNNYPVIGITQQKMTSLVMEATTFGAYETLQRPLDKEVVLRRLEELKDFSAEIKNTIPIRKFPPTPTCVIVGHSPIIMDVCKKLARLSQVDAPVLITGETGTGKELIAESITQLSSRFGKPFIVVNCAAVPETLIESELFGFEKGAFTNAVAKKEGIFKIADEGCVFLDEVGDLPLSLQAKLLRFLQTQTFYPIGSTKEIQVNVRVISATNRDLPSMVREGRFREDLYHRLSVTSIHIPPLRDRKEDILPLVQFFINRYRHTSPHQIKGITEEYLKKLLSHNWPGNIRELENTIRSSIALSKADYLTTYELKELESKPLPMENNSFQERLSSVLIPFVKESIDKKDKDIYEKLIKEVDKCVFEFILSYTNENQSEASRILGINRLTLRKKLR